MSKTLSVLCAGLLLVSAAQARQKFLEYRKGDAMHGPLESVRTEAADVTVTDGQPWEGPRRLTQVKKYSPDGKRSETTGYAPDGSVRGRTFHVYDDGGNLIETSSYDGKGATILRRVYVRRGDEVSTFDGEGRLLERVVTTWNAARDAMAEVHTYDGAGALVKRDVNTRDAGGTKSTWESYGPDGKLLVSRVHELDSGGGRRHDETTFRPSGAVAGRRVATSDAATRSLGAVETGPEGSPRRRTHETREYDSRRNLVKLTSYKWDEAGGEFVPYHVSYHIITYRD